METFSRLTEILILVVLPLLVLYVRSTWVQKVITVNVTILPILWYVSYAPLHELGHIAGCILVGFEIKDFQLFSHFWTGDFGFAFVDIKEGYGENMKSFVVLMSPYFFDVFGALTGYFILSRYDVKNAFLFGLIFLLLNVRPLYDLVDNFIGYFYNHSDFVLAGKIIGSTVLDFFVVVAVIIVTTVMVLLLIKFSRYPQVDDGTKLKKPRSF